MKILLIPTAMYKNLTDIILVQKSGTKEYTLLDEIYLKF